jgi:serine/threonine-protein kinase RsbW
LTSNQKDRIATLAVPRSRQCGAIARRWLEQQVGKRLSGQRLDDLKLMVTELVENAYVHGRGEITLTLRLAERRARVEVTDEGHDRAVRIRRDGPELGGWGLQLIEALSLQWGAYEGTTHVWAELGLD